MAESEMKIEVVPPKHSVEINIGGPLIFWIAMLIIGVVTALVFEPIFAGTPGIKALLASISGWILFLPGSLILPLIVSIWIGEMVGSNKAEAKAAVKYGEINAISAVLLYVVAIVIIYLLFFYISPSALQSYSLVNFLEYTVLIPAVIMIVLTPLVSALSGARHSEA